MKTLTNTAKANLLRAGAVAMGAAAVGVLLVQGSTAAFTANTDSKSNAIESGTVALEGAGTAMFNLGNLNGGQTVERCITVTYGGTLTSDIRLYGVASGELASGLATTIQLGTGAVGGRSFDCTGFVPAVAPPGSVAPYYSGSLEAFSKQHSNYATGITGFDAATKGASKSYKVTMTVSNLAMYQGKSAAVDFTWEAQGKDSVTTNR
jgi:predicted ribosomally synthesized peptide with SipW-like signal peptide